MLVHQQVWPGGRQVAIVGDDEELAATVRAAIEMFDGELVAQTHESPVVHARDGVTASIQIGAEPAQEVDIVAICAGQQPDIALALMLECATGFSDALGGFVPVRSADMETSVAGDIRVRSRCGHRKSRCLHRQRVIAAEAAARSLDSWHDEATDSHRRPVSMSDGWPGPRNTGHASMQRYRSRPNGNSTPSPRFEQRQKSTMSEQNEPVFTCRCYEVSRADIADAIARGATTVNDVKRMTRAAMGLCQGIYCVPEITNMLTEAGQPRETVAPMTSRPPARLVSLAEIESLVPEPGE
ncbi:MAG: (2Fe-2S)-binding protein [Thermomicrobiales bacterium]